MIQWNLLQFLNTIVSLREFDDVTSGDIQADTCVSCQGNKSEPNAVQFDCVKIEDSIDPTIADTDEQLGMDHPSFFIRRRI